MTKNKPIFDESRIRNLMERDGIDLILSTSRTNVGYLSNWFTHQWTWDWPFWFEMEKEYDGGDYLLMVGIPANNLSEAFFITYDHHVSSVLYQSWIKDVRGAGRPGYKPRKGLDSVLLEPVKMVSHLERAVEAIKDKGFSEATIGVEMCRISQMVYAKLTKSLPKAKFVDCFETIMEVRAVKSSEEIGKLRRASEITTLIFIEVIFPMLKDKAKPYEIYQESLSRAAYERGYFLFLHVFVDGGHILMVGDNNSSKEPVPYNINPEYCLKDGQLVFIDFGCGYKGYCADMCRNLVIGRKASDRQFYFHEALLNAHREIGSTMRAGVKASEIFNVGVTSLDKKNLGLALSFVGHGIGLSNHEPPYLTAFDNRPLELGMVINIEPNIEVPGMTMFNVEDTGVLTEEGFELFTSLDTNLNLLS